VAVLVILGVILAVYLVKRRKRVVDDLDNDVDAVGLTDVKAVAEQQPPATTQS
jgi:hypothetical protein